MSYIMGMITYPTLYARATTGAVLVWWQEQDGDLYRTVSGQIDSPNLVRSNWKKAEPKNEGKANATTGAEQATAEVLADYKKKKKLKYKTTVEEIDDDTYIKPMLAKKLSEYADKINLFDKSWLFQIKYNGVCTTLSKTYGIRSRTGEKFLSVPHIISDFSEFFKDYPDAVLHGEMFNYELRKKLNQLIKIVRKTKLESITPEDYILSEEMVRFYGYNGYGFGKDLGKDAPYKDRKAFIDEVLPKYSQYFREVPTFQFEDQESFDVWYNGLIEDGQEGAMAYKVDSIYENKRSKNLLKIKPEDDAEAKIIAIHEGIGNWVGTGKTMTLEWTDDQGIVRVFDATLKGTLEEAKTFWENREWWIGQTVTFLYMGLTGLGDGLPNYARVDYNNCLKADDQPPKQKDQKTNILADQYLQEELQSDDSLYSEIQSEFL